MTAMWRRRPTTLSDRLCGERPEWMTRGACLGCDPDLFFPERGHNNDGDAAKAVCRRCPVREQCLDHAITNNEKEGIWGGTSGRERRRMRAAAAKAVA